MATVAEIQAQLGNFGKEARIVRTVNGADEGLDRHYVIGGVGQAGRSRWCETSTISSAATQAGQIITQLKA
jgi:hypothetical protein